MNQPSEETKLKMAEFFMKTSIPRILAKERGMEDEKNTCNTLSLSTGSKNPK